MRAVVRGRYRLAGIDHELKIELTHDEHGWVRNVKLISVGQVEIGGEAFHNLMGRRFGWGQFKSPHFTVRRDGDDWVFEGTGLGHGVGMCQYGAIGMARAGRSWRAILKHYYPTATFVRTDGWTRER